MLRKVLTFLIMNSILVYPMLQCMVCCVLCWWCFWFSGVVLAVWYMVLNIWLGACVLPCVNTVSNRMLFFLSAVGHLWVDLTFYICICKHFLWCSFIALFLCVWLHPLHSPFYQICICCLGYVLWMLIFLPTVFYTSYICSLYLMFSGLSVSCQNYFFMKAPPFLSNSLHSRIASQILSQTFRE
jgi:hypothetical protein